jgi:hypothetical protein
MKFVDPTADELSDLRADPLIFEQELDVRPAVAEALERALGFRAGRRYWLAQSGHLYAIELGDFGRGRPSMALVYGFWPSFEPRPLSDEQIDEDLAELCTWMTTISDELDAEVMTAVLDLARTARVQGNAFRLPL